MTNKKLQQEAEQLYPLTGDKNVLACRPYSLEEAIRFQQSAHVACAEKYTAIIDQLKQKHKERTLILALDMQKKDQEIERLREGLHLISGRAELGIQDMTEATGCLVRIKQYASDALKTPTP